MPTQLSLTPRTTAPILVLVTAGLLSGCGEQAGDPDGPQSAGQPGDVIGLPATPDQLQMLDAVVERFPELAPLAERARADGEVTEQEIIRVFTEAERLKGSANGD